MNDSHIYPLFCYDIHGITILLPEQVMNIQKMIIDVFFNNFVHTHCNRDMEFLRTNSTGVKNDYVTRLVGEIKSSARDFPPNHCHIQNLSKHTFESEHTVTNNKQDVQTYYCIIG